VVKTKNQQTERKTPTAIEPHTY